MEGKCSNCGRVGEVVVCFRCRKRFCERCMVGRLCKRCSLDLNLSSESIDEDYF